MTPVEQEALDMLESACRYLRGTYGRTATETPRGIITSCIRKVRNPRRIEISTGVY